MAKAVVYTLLATALIVFLVFVPSNPRHYKATGLNRRLGSTFPIPTFDPLVAKIERYAKEKGLDASENPFVLNQTSFSDEVSDANQYFSDEGKLNITLRLVVLFPILDQAPKDGVIDTEELKAWLTQQAIDRLNHRTQKELDSYDHNGDAAISFGEYLPQFSEQDIAKNEMEHGEAGWWKQQFSNADDDQNGNLNFDELKDFLHPEDSKNPQIQTWLLTEKIKRMDQNSDDKLSFSEFLEHAYDTYQNYLEFEAAGGDVPTAEDKFRELDLNKDKFLDAEELKPILHYLQPGEVSYAKYYTSYLIHEVDDDGDGKLTLEEMLNHEFIFYTQCTTTAMGIMMKTSTTNFDFCFQFMGG